MKHFFDSVVSVVTVKDYAAARAWYSQLLGEPASEHEPGAGEWKIGGTWLRVTEDPSRAGHAIAVLMTQDLAGQIVACKEHGMSVGETQDFGFMRLAIVADLDGNQLQMIEAVAEG